MVEDERNLEKALKRVEGCDSVIRELSRIRGGLRHYLVCSVLQPALLFEIRSHIATLSATAVDQGVNRISFPKPHSDKLIMQIALRKRRSPTFTFLESDKHYVLARRRGQREYPASPI